MARALVLRQRSRIGMDGSSLPLRRTQRETTFDPNESRFMRDAQLAGVLAVGRQVHLDEKAPDAVQAEEVAVAPARVETTRKTGELATRATAHVDNEISDELIAEIDASATVEATSV